MPGCRGGQGEGVGLAERAPAGVGGRERGITQRGAQLGMVAVAQPRLNGLESSSGPLVAFVGDAVQGGSDLGVAVGAGRQGEAEQRAVNIRRDAGDPGCVQAGGEVAAGVAGVGVDEVDETQVLPQTDGESLVTMLSGQHARLLKVRPGRAEIPGRVLVDGKVCQRGGEPVVVSGRP